MRSGTITRAFGLCHCGLWLCIRWGSAAPLGLNKCVPIINPGLAPWAMQEYRPYRAPLRLHHQSSKKMVCIKINLMQTLFRIRAMTA